MNKVKKIYIIIFIILSLLSFTKSIYAKYILTKEFCVTTTSSSAFYFDATLSNNNSTITFPRTSSSTDYDQILTTTTSFDIVIHNNDGTNYNKFDTTYEITVLNSNKFTFEEGEKITKVIEGNSKVDETITLKLKIKDLTLPDKTVTIRVTSTNPYKKSVELTFKVKQDGAIQTIEDLMDLSLSVRGLNRGANISVVDGPSYDLASDSLPEISIESTREKTINELVEEAENEMYEPTPKENRSVTPRLSTESSNATPRASVDYERYKLTRNLDFKSKDSYENADRGDYADANGDGNTSATLYDEMTTNAGFLPIGIHRDENGQQHDFHGVLNGGGYTISNLWIHKAKQENIGLFGYIANGIVKKLNVTGNVENKNQTAGMIVGKMDGGTIENVKTDGVVRSLDEASPSRDTYAGGIAGYTELNSTIKNCENNASVTTQFSGDTTTYSGPAGGITAWLVDSNIESCINRGTVTGQKFVGGIAGFCAIKGDGNISKSENYGKVTVNVNTTASAGPGQDVGGIAGYNGATGQVTSCKNHESASEYGMNYVGGIVGYNYGKVQSNENFTSNITAKGTNVGRIVGINKTGGTVTGNTDHVASGDVPGELPGIDSVAPTESVSTQNVDVINTESYDYSEDL